MTKRNLEDTILSKEQVEGLSSCLARCGIQYSIYDYDAHTLQELICILYAKVNEVVDIANLTLELAKWLVSEGLDIVVREQLQIWLEDGTLADIINVEIFKDLNNRIDDVLAQLEDLRKEVQDMFDAEKEINIETMEPYFITECDLIVDNVQQGLAVHPTTGEYFVASLYKTPSTSGEWATDYQHFQITRCAPNGKRLEYMIFKNGGHGTEFGLEIDETGQIYIWNAWEESAISGGTASGPGNAEIPGATVPHRVGRVKWSNGAIVLPQNAEYSFQQPTPGYLIPTISSCQKYIGYRHDRMIYICDFALVKAGQIGLISTFEIPSADYYLQGFTLDDKFVYWRSGTGTEYTGPSFKPDTLIKVDWRTGEILERRILMLYTGDLDGFMEPEGIHIHVDERGYKTLFLGTTHGQTLGGRRRCVYAIGEEGSAISALGGASKPSDNEPWRTVQGRTKMIPKGTTKLSSFINTGWYYIASAQHEEFTDVPSAFAGGAWIFNSPRNTDGVFYQQYIRNTSENMFILTRTVNTNTGAVGRWAGSGQEESIYENGSEVAVGTTKTFMNGRSVNDFDYIIIKYSGGGGGNHADQIIYRPYSGNTIIQTGINLADNSPTNVYAYEHAIELNSAGTAFTLTRRNCVASSGAGWVDSSVSNAIYISRIIGVNK